MGPQRSGHRGLPRPSRELTGVGKRQRAEADDEQAGGLEEVSARRHAGHHLRRALDRGLNAVIRHAAAQGAGHPLADLRVGRVGVLVEQHLGGQDLAVLAEAALRHLLVDPRLLDRMQHAVFREPLERGDLGALHRRHRPDARAHRFALDDDRARAALAEPASESRPLQAEIVAQDVEQRSRRLDVHGVRLPVHLQREIAHRPQISICADRLTPKTGTDSDKLGAGLAPAWHRGRCADRLASHHPITARSLA